MIYIRCAAIIIGVETLLLMLMWGRIERFDEKVGWCEQQIIDIKKEAHHG